MEDYNMEQLESIADELYKLNANIQNLTCVLADISGKPLKHLNEDGFEYQKWLNTKTAIPAINITDVTLSHSYEASYSVGIAF